MAGVNRVHLIGHIGKNPEVKTLESGAKVATFSLATTESYKDKNTGERVDKTEWHNIVLWKGLADITERFLKKGSQVYIEGKIQYRSYEKDGVTRYSTEILGSSLTMLSKNSDSSQGSVPAQVVEDNGVNNGQEIDDLPF